MKSMMSLNAGAAVVDITPAPGIHMMGFFQDRIADGIHDRLFAKAIVLSSEETMMGFIVCDLVVMPETVADEAKAIIEKKFNIPATNILICSTHTHTGPAIDGAFLTPRDQEYGAWAAERIAESFCGAAEHLETAEVGCAMGNCDSEVHNRRYHMKDGTVRMNPGYLNPEIVGPAGPVDPAVTLMILRRPKRQAIAVLANLALHYAGTGEPTKISADYYGKFSAVLQQRAAGCFVAAMANGCSGDINNIDPTRPAPASPHPYSRSERVGSVTAEAAWNAWQGLQDEDFFSSVKIGSRLERVPFLARMPSEDELVSARVRLKDGPKPTARDPQDREWIYAREIALMNECPAVSDVPIQAMRIGSLGVVGLPGEAFVEIGLEIKRRSPFRHTMVIGLANAWAGYVATDRALDQGGYETRLCRHVRAAKGTARIWADTAVTLLQGLNEN